MTKDYKFDTTARSERYLTGTIFTHLLMENNFSLLKIIFNDVLDTNYLEDTGTNEYEIVTEIDHLRDGAKLNTSVNRYFLEHGRIAVPDLFLRINNYCLVIEAKFFTDPSINELQRQIEQQIKAIEIVKKHTKYADTKIHHAVLTVFPKQINVPNIIALTWEEVISIANRINHKSDSYKYSLKILSIALERAQKELKHCSINGWKRIKFTEIISHIPSLINEGYVFIGYDGGSKRLKEATKKDLATKTFFQVSRTAHSENWIPLDIFIKKLIELNDDKKTKTIPT